VADEGGGVDGGIWELQVFQGGCAVDSEDIRVDGLGESKGEVLGSAGSDGTYLEGSPPRP
jgi:hypothetical protein